ncbi:MAG TPA: FAD-dependent oxidoreductase [Candidatus Paceibacterota bacterium]|nr:FAD-dependent oxidoreductase [Candidatus Paceibacterota bacterium]
MSEFKNNSPWIYQVNKQGYNLTSQVEGKDIETDVAIIGGGIAGIATAFFTLKYTNKSVVLLEGYKIAHGATGHNAGQITSYFERSLQSLKEEYGLEQTVAAQKAIDTAWLLLDEIYTDAQLTIPFARFIGHSGLSSTSQILHFLKENIVRKEGGTATEFIRIADHVDVGVPLDQYEGLYERIPQEKILQMLETEDDSYIASMSFQKGCMNSALFCYEAASYMLRAYKDRFRIFEHSRVGKILLRKDNAVLDVGTYEVCAKKVVLCTNGFKHLTIIGEDGLESNAKFHHLVKGTVGYMSGYVENTSKPPTAISYFIDPAHTNDDPYFYMTRRQFEYADEAPVTDSQSLICIGGPEGELADHEGYSTNDEYPEIAAEGIQKFVEKTLKKGEKVSYGFTWHGLMGYTRSRMRLIGPDPKHQPLMYNLGCNGVGILPSLHGGRKIASVLAGQIQEKSIFDVPSDIPKS